MDILYFTHPLNGILMIAIPVLTGIFITRKCKTSWGLWWAGSLTFILSQVAHIPFNLLFLNSLIADTVSTKQTEFQTVVFTSALLGLSAGLFEETARYISYRWWQKGARSWAKAVTFGAGHGGIEAILLGFVVLVTFFQMVTLREADLLSIVPEKYVSLVQQQIDLYWSIPWYVSLMGALERVFTIPFHISAAVLVLQTFKRQQIRWLLTAIIWHASVDALIVSVAQLWGVYAAEGMMSLIAITSVGIILAFREPLDEQELLPPLRELLTIEELQKIEISDENLEKTRYNQL